MKYQENETIELKRSTSELKEAVIAVTAMLNKHGQGKVYFGIKNGSSGIIVGKGLVSRNGKGWPYWSVEAKGRKHSQNQKYYTAMLGVLTGQQWANIFIQINVGTVVTLWIT